MSDFKDIPTVPLWPAYPVLTQPDKGKTLADVLAVSERYSRAIGEPESPVDKAVEMSVTTYQQIPPRIWAAERLTDLQQSTLFLFAKRQAVAVMRGGDAGRLRKGLVALAMEDCCYDFRDTLCSLVMLYYAAQKIGADFSSLVRETQPHFSEKFTRFCDDFLKRPASSKTLECMGLVQTTDQYGVTIEFAGHKDDKDEVARKPMGSAAAGLAFVFVVGNN